MKIIVINDTKYMSDKKGTILFFFVNNNSTIDL